MGYRWSQRPRFNPSNTSCPTQPPPLTNSKQRRCRGTKNRPRGSRTIKNKISTACSETQKTFPMTLPRSLYRWPRQRSQKTTRDGCRSSSSSKCRGWLPCKIMVCWVRCVRNMVRLVGITKNKANKWMAVRYTRSTTPLHRFIQVMTDRASNMDLLRMGIRFINNIQLPITICIRIRTSMDQWMWIRTNTRSPSPLPTTRYPSKIIIRITCHPRRRRPSFTTTNTLSNI